MKLDDPKSPDNVNWYKVTDDGDVLLDDSDTIAIERAKGGSFSTYYAASEIFIRMQILSLNAHVASYIHFHLSLSDDEAITFVPIWQIQGSYFLSVSAYFNFISPFIFGSGQLHSKHISSYLVSH